MNNTLEIGQLVGYSDTTFDYHGLGVITKVDNLNKVFHIAWFHTKNSSGTSDPQGWRVDWGFDEYRKRKNNNFKVLS